MGDDRVGREPEAKPPQAEARPRPELPSVDLEPRSVAPGSLSLSPGTVVADKFALQRIIASGGMGTVFEAWDTLVERKVALKLMHPVFVHDPSMVARFRREAQAAARIQHPNVVNVLEVGRRRDGTFYIVQELLVGETLREHLMARTRLPPEEALSLLVPVMSGIAAAHASGIIHRDLKPENIILARSPSGEVIPKIIDFGLAKLHDANKQSLTGLGTLLGTPQYMSPEQVLAEKVDARSDVWAMGVMLFEVLSGIMPFSGDTLARLLGRIVSPDPPPDLAFVAPAACAPFAPIVRRALERDLNTRYQSIREMRDDLLSAHGKAHVIVTNAAVSASHVVPAELHALDPVFDVPPDMADAFDVGPAPAKDANKTRAPALTPLPASRSEWGGPDKPDEQDPAKLAQDALEVNALNDAIRWAEISLERSHISEDTRGRTWLVVAIANRWLGAYGEVVRAAQEAMLRLPRGSSGWHAAFGHLVIAYGYLGRKDRLLARVDELAAVEEEEGVTTEAHIVSECRCAVFVIRAGVPQLGRKLAREAHHHVASHASISSFLRGWLAAARAELALVDGDPAAYLRRVEVAQDAFTEASDVRNATLQRTNVGRAYMLLGTYERAYFVLQRAVAVAEPMLLDFVPFAQSILGYCLSHLGRAEEGARIIDAAIATCRARNDKRRERVLLTHMARIRLRQGHSAQAASLARAAAEVPDDGPAERAHALGVLADALLSEGNAAAALAPASEAAAIADRLGALEEGEALVRITHVLALLGAGQEQDAMRKLLEAHNKLLQKADKIRDRGFKKSFLENVPEHKRLVQLATQWGLA